VCVEQSTQELRVLLVVITAYLADAVKGADCTGVSLSSKHHHLVRVDMHNNFLVYAKQTKKEVRTSERVTS